MSLLDLKTNKSNKRFIQKMYHQYSKKRSSSSMAQYQLEKQKKQALLNPIKVQADSLEKQWKDVQVELQTVLKPFKQGLEHLLDKINDQSKYYRVLTLMRKHQLLHDISARFNQKIINQNFQIKRQITQLKKITGQLSKKQRNLEQSISANNPQKNVQNSEQRANSSIKTDILKSMSQNIYLQSKKLNQLDFILWCDKILMKNKIVIIDVKKDRSPNKNLSKTHSFLTSPQRSVSQFYQKEAQKQYPEIFGKYSQVTRKIEELSPLIQIKEFEQIKINLIKQIEQLKLEKIQCKNICCKFEKQRFSQKKANSLTKMLNESLKAKIDKQKQVYQDSKTKQYFKRYYKHPQFKVNQIKSVQQTKSEQMNRLQNQYLKMVELRNKKRYGY